jgi:glutathione-regulated potassium-efflux system protein KefB
MISQYLIDIIILLVAAVIAVPAFQALRLGAVPGFLISGVVVGPSGLGLISNIQEISHLAEIGVVLLLFVIGVELRPARLWLMRYHVFGLGSLQILVSGLLIGAVCHLVFDLSLPTATLIGPALALSSTAFVLQLLAEQKRLHSTYGRTSLAVLLMQDLAVVPLLALIPLLAMPEMDISADVGYALLESLVMLVLLVIIGRYLLHPVLHRVALSGNSEIFTASAVLIVLGTALVTEHIGMSMAMGAFLAGLLISDSAYRHQIIAEIQPMRGLLLGLFFMSMGMSLNLNSFLQDPLFAVLLLASLLAIKIVVLFPLALLFGVKRNCAIAVSLILSQSGEFALVLFSLSHQANLLNDALFQQLLMLVLLSMLVTPPLARLAERFSRAETDQFVSPEEEQDKPQASVIVAGFGRMGHRIGDILSQVNIPYIALDYNAELVARQRKNDHPVFYGDVCKPEVIRAAGANNASAIIITLDDPKGIEKIVKALRSANADIDIYARGSDLAQCKRLHEIGATHTVSESLEASLELARLAMLKSGLDSSSSDNVVKTFRKTYRQQMNEPSE